MKRTSVFPSVFIFAFMIHSSHSYAADSLGTDELRNVFAKGTGEATLPGTGSGTGMEGIASLILVAADMNTGSAAGGGVSQESMATVTDGFLTTVLDAVMVNKLFSYDNFESDYSMSDKSGISIGKDGSMVLRLAGEINHVRFENLRLANDHGNRAFGSVEIAGGAFDVNASFLMASAH